MEYLLGILVSLVVEGVKKFAGEESNKWLTLLWLFGLSLLAGVVYWAFQYYSSLFPVIAQILVTAAAFHNLVIRQLYPEN